MTHSRLSIVIAIVVAVVVVAALLSHGLRVRLIWGSSGFVAGLICGALLMLEIEHRRKRSR
ncbi:MAG TPA: hypothetical protein VLX59_07470 [Acidimicrobiales bacterium]|nr:hypothetical protein [Acidimicrobiales bacterium]